MSDFNSLVQYTVENISRPVKYIIYKLTEFIRVVDKFIFRQVPAGAASGYATIEQIEGNTVAWNQQVDNNHIHQVVTGTKNNNAITDYNIVGVENHVYYVRCVGTITGNMLLRFRNPFVSYAGNSFAPNSFFTLNGASDSRYNLQVKQGDVTNIFDLNVIDLTAIFGEGNEPTTVADFEAWLAQNIGTLPYYDYNAGELLSVKMSGMQTEDSSQQTIDTMALDVTTITGINTATNIRETIFPNGMKQADRAGTVKDTLDLLSDMATVKCGYYEISGSEDWEAVSTYPGVYRIPSRTPSNVASMNGDSIGKCSHYALCPIRASISSILTNGQFGWNQSYYLHIKDERYADAASFKVYLAAQYAAGTPVTIVYPINPITYTDLQDANGDPINPRYKVEQSGTEQVLPVNTSTPTTVAPTLSTIYKKNA